MKRSKWACFKYFANLCVLLLAAGLGATALAQVTTITSAQAQFMPAGGPDWAGQIALPHPWDKSYPGRAGRALYSVELPPISPPGAPQALYFPRVGNQIEIRVGGQVLERRGQLGDGGSDAAKSPLWVPVPENLLSPTHGVTLEVMVTVQPGRWGGLAAPMFGPVQALYPIYRERYVWRQWGSVAVIFSLTLMGIIAAGLWAVQRDPLYAFFSFAALFGALRFADRLWESPPLGWPLWGGVMALCLALHQLLIVRFSLALIGRDGAIIRRCFWILVVLESTAALSAFVFGNPVLWTLALALLVPPSLWAYALAARQAVTLRQREAIALCLASLLPLVAGVRDFVAVRVADDGAGRFSYLPLATTFFILLMGWLITDRFARQSRQYQNLLATLDEKVRQREQELEASHLMLQQGHAKQATLIERQRIMRDIHDGVGAQLVGLLSLIRSGRAKRDELQEQANSALDELRMVVDAMQPVNGDLATVLATLRYRLQPRLVAAGIAVDWQVEELPLMPHLTPQTVLQIQRILLEAFTNILRHAQATRVRVGARQETPPSGQLILEIADNGIGMAVPEPAGGGQGLANMRARSQAIGAELLISSAPASGTSVVLQLPAHLPVHLPAAVL